jgi:hypothetical protein
MLVIFFNIKGIVREVFALAGHTVKSENYCGVLRRLRENVYNNHWALEMFNNFEGNKKVFFFAFSLFLPTKRPAIQKLYLMYIWPTDLHFLI